MKLFTILAFAVMSVTAAPLTFLIGEATREQVVVAQRPEPVKILKQVHQLNDDGSYTFGFEAADGSFRKEVRDVTGHVTGRYGYIDANGQLHELEYVSGQQSGRTLGFQPKSTLIPVSVVPVVPPPVDQKGLDFQYSSVDDNHDGQPDHAAVQQLVLQAPTVLRYVQEPSVQTVVVQQAKQAVVSVAPPAVDQRNLDYQYHSVDENQDGQPDAPVLAQQVVYQTPTVLRYVQEAPVQTVVVEQAKQTVVPVIPPIVDQKNLDYQYHSVDENQDGQPDAPVQQVVYQAPTVLRYEQAPVQTVVVQQAKQTVVPVIPPTVDQKNLDYQYHSVDENQDGQPDAPVQQVVYQAPTVLRYEQAPVQTVVVQQAKQTVVPVIPPTVDQKNLDYQYHSVDENQDGQPDAPVQQVVYQAPTIQTVVVEQVKQTVVPVIPPTVDQKNLDYQYHSVDENQDGQPDAPVQQIVYQAPTIVRYAEVPVQTVVVQQAKQTVVPVIPPTVDQKNLDYQYHSVDENQDGQPDAPVQQVVYQAPTVLRNEQVPAVVQSKQTVTPVVIGKTSTSDDQKYLDYQYSSVDENQDGQPDVPAAVVRLEEFPTIIHTKQTVVPVVVGKTVSSDQSPTVIRTVQQVGNTEVDQFIKDLRYHSVDADEDGIPDEAIDVTTLPVVPTVLRRYI